MRSNSLVMVAATLAVGLAGCQCGQKLATLSSSLIITEPTTKDADGFVVDFGVVRVGQSVSKQIIVENHGNADATITARALRMGSDPEFELSGSLAPKGVAPSGSFVVNVTYTPSKRGTNAGVVDLASSDSKLAMAAIKLKGEAQAGSVEVCAETQMAGTFDCASLESNTLTINFGSMLLNVPPVPRKVRIRNTGNAPLNYIGSAFIDPTSLEFTMNPDQGLAQKALDPAAEHIYSIVFTPAVDATVSGTAQVVTDDPTLPLVNIQLQATAAAAVTCKLTVSPASVPFGSVPTGSSQDATVTIFNAGTLPCNISAITKTGSSAFTLTGTATKVDPKVSVKLNVHYSPPGTQNDTGNIAIDSDDPVNPHLNVALSGSGIEPPPCVLVATPSFINFGGTQVGDRAIGSVNLSAQGSDPCTVLSAKLASNNSNFIVPPIPLLPPMTIFPGGLPGFGGGSIGVTYAPTVARTDNETLVITYQAGLFSGPKLTLNVPITARSGTRQLCITPQRLHFGAVPVGQSKPLTFTMTACGGAAVTVTSMKIVTAGGPFTLTPTPPANQVITAGGNAMQVVVATPTSTANVANAVEVLSSDAVFPRQLVPLDMGPETVPADAGEIMYTWQAAAITTTQEGTVMKTNLQGPPNRSPFYGTKAGQSCAGCHAVSPDGKYVALIEYGSSPTMRIIDARSGGAVAFPGAAGGQFPSWNPNPKTNPPYQFIYNEGNILKIASMTAGIIGELKGAAPAGKIATQPSWGPNGTIAYVLGDPTADGGEFGIGGPSDLMIIPESGGTPVPVAGASGTKAENYMPEFSPNGKYIAYTYSQIGESTRSAKDSVIRLVEVATGTISMLPQLNAAGPNSWPTWSKDGMWLSFSSTRGGGKGSADIYYAPVNQNTGIDGPAVNMSNVNTSDYDHISRWAPLPPP